MKGPPRQGKIIYCTEGKVHHHDMKTDRGDEQSWTDRGSSEKIRDKFRDKWRSMHYVQIDIQASTILLKISLYRLLETLLVPGPGLTQPACIGPHRHQPVRTLQFATHFRIIFEQGRPHLCSPQKPQKRPHPTQPAAHLTYLCSHIAPEMSPITPLSGYIPWH